METVRASSGRVIDQFDTARFELGQGRDQIIDLIGNVMETLAPLGHELANCPIWIDWLQ